MKFEDVIDMMLTLLDDYQIANITDEELKLETSIKVNMVISRTSFEELTFDMETEEFSRDLTVLEATILS